MTEELKNCPFCGGKAELKANQDGNIFQVHCPCCKAQNLWSVNAAELWNNRTRKVTDLKPCPICGKKVRVIQIDEATFVIQCFQCGLTTDYFDTPDDAKTAWNRRPSEK